MKTRKLPIVLIPAYQPQHMLIETTNRLLADDYTVVVVDDGSGADYRDIFNKLHGGVHLVRYATNRGKGAALKSGFEYIRKRFHNFIVVTADADGQHDVADIQKVALGYQQYTRTLLLGARTFESGHVPLRSKFGNVLTRKVFSLITKQQLHDTQTGLRAFDESLVDFMMYVPGERFEYEMNVLLACSRQGVPMVEFPIQTIYKNGNETSHFDPIRDSLTIYKQIAKFASSSLLAFGVDYGMFMLLLSLTTEWAVAVSVVFANIFARLVSASFNFVVNRRLIFEHKSSIVKDMFSYALLAVCILISNTILLTILTSILDVTPYVAKVIAETVMFFASYYVQKNIIFTQKKRNVRNI